jgi:hypothetical protein
VCLEPGLLEELERRVGLAEAKFMEADLELRLEQLEQAKQRQVTRILGNSAPTLKIYK